TGRTPATTTPSATARRTHSAMKSGGVIGHSESCSTSGSSASCTPSMVVRASRGSTPASESAQVAQVTSASPCTSANGSEPRPSSTTRPSAITSTSIWLICPPQVKGPARPKPGGACQWFSSRSGGEHLVEDGLGLVLVGVLGQGQLGDEDLARLGQHPLLAGREATVTLAAPQVANDLGHLHHVAAVQLLEVGLVAARPVGRLLDVRSAQDVEH